MPPVTPAGSSGATNREYLTGPRVGQGIYDPWGNALERWIQVGSSSAIDLVGLPVADVGGQVVNVQAYGAKGDGVADDTAAIQAAIAAITATQGSELFFPAGTYLITAGLTIHRSNVTVRGAGRQSVIKAKDQARIATYLFGVDGAFSNVWFRELTVDGNRANWGTDTAAEVIGIAIGTGATDCAVVDCEVKNVAFVGIDLSQTGYGGLIDVRHQILNNYVHDNGSITAGPTAWIGADGVHVGTVDRTAGNPFITCHGSGGLTFNDLVPGQWVTFGTGGAGPFPAETHKIATVNPSGADFTISTAFIDGGNIANTAAGTTLKIAPVGSKVAGSGLKVEGAYVPSVGTTAGCAQHLLVEGNHFENNYAIVGGPSGSGCVIDCNYVRVLGNVFKNNVNGGGQLVEAGSSRGQTRHWVVGDNQFLMDASLDFAFGGKTSGMELNGAAFKIMGNSFIGHGSATGNAAAISFSNDGALGAGGIATISDNLISGCYWGIVQGSVSGPGLLTQISIIGNHIISAVVGLGFHARSFHVSYAHNHFTSCTKDYDTDYGSATIWANTSTIAASGITDSSVDGNWGIGTTSFGAGTPNRMLGIAHASNPTGAPSGGGVLFSQPTGKLYWWGESMLGALQLAPHDFISGAGLTSIDIGDGPQGGTNNTIAQGDHQHPFPAAVGQTANIGNANTDGGNTTPARSDHVHNHPAGLGVNLHHDKDHSHNVVGGGATVNDGSQLSNLTVASGLVCTAGDIGVDNTRGFDAKDSGGTYRQLLKLDASNHCLIGPQAGGNHTKFLVQGTVRGDWDAGTLALTSTVLKMDNAWPISWNDFGSSTVRDYLMLNAGNNFQVGPQSGTGSLQLYAAGAVKGLMNATGLRVGDGTAPLATLDVNGTATIRNTLTVTIGGAAITGTLSSGAATIGGNLNVTSGGATIDGSSVITNGDFGLDNNKQVLIRDTTGTYRNMLTLTNTAAAPNTQRCQIGPTAVIGGTPGDTEVYVNGSLGLSIDVTSANTKVWQGLEHKGAAVGFYNTAPIAKPTLAAAATDAATTQTLANSIRTKLIALGLCA